MNKHAVVITGAAGGIGQGLVEVFAKAGYEVIATARKPDVSIRKAQFVAADLARTASDEQYAASVFAEIRRCLGGRPLKALINNAATQILGPVEKLSRADWRTTLEVNLLAPFFWTQALLPELEAARGSVINIGSIHSKLTKARFTAYSTSKSALNGLTRALALELGSRVRVNVIEPAAIETPMLEAGFREDPSGYRKLKDFHPTRSIGTPRQVAKLALAMVDDELTFMNGSTVALDGGIGSVLHDPAPA